MTAGDAGRGVGGPWQTRKNGGRPRGNRKSTDPDDYMGVYKRLGDVPDRYRLQNFAGQYADRDVWAEWFEVHREDEWSDRTIRDYARTETWWKDHMADRGRHHALAVPNDVETWCCDLLSEYGPATVRKFWSHLDNFYAWLYYHADHPHVYNSVWIAAATGTQARRVWANKMQTTRKK